MQLIMLCDFCALKKQFPLQRKTDIPSVTDTAIRYYREKRTKQKTNKHGDTKPNIKINKNKILTIALKPTSTRKNILVAAKENT